MEKTHKRALLTAALIAAALAGTVFALFPAWERHKAEEKQEAMLSRLEISMPEKETGLQTQGTGLFKEPVKAARAAADTAVAMAAVQETAVKPEAGKIPETAAEPETEGKPETAAEPEAEGKPETAASPETAEKPEGDMPQAGAEIGILSIPKIGARLPVTAGVSEGQLKISEGWVMQTAMIGSVGNAVVAGHRSYTYGKHFNRLGELETGDKIFYTAADGTEMSFTVSEILTVSPDDPAVFAAPPEGASQLTLYTCTPVKVATHRLLVRALRMEE